MPFVLTPYLDYHFEGTAIENRNLDQEPNIDIKDLPLPYISENA